MDRVACRLKYWLDEWDGEIKLECADREAWLLDCLLFEVFANGLEKLKGKDWWFEYWLVDGDGLKRRRDIEALIPEFSVEELNELVELVSNIYKK